jgi:hypothetical protein
MNKQLVNVIQQRRQSAGNGQSPLGFGKFGEAIGVNGSMIYRFCAGKRMLDISTVRKLATHAARGNDLELLEALSQYALGIIT